MSMQLRPLAGRGRGGKGSWYGSHTAKGSESVDKRMVAMVVVKVRTRTGYRSVRVWWR